MSAYSMRFSADIRTRPDVTDVDAHLARGVQAVRAHPQVASATFEHGPNAHRVSFDIQLRFPIAPQVDAVTAHRALHDSLERAGFGDTRLPPSSEVPVRLRIDSWPSWS